MVIYAGNESAERLLADLLERPEREEARHEQEEAYAVEREAGRVYGARRERNLVEAGLVELVKISERMALLARRIYDVDAITNPAQAAALGNVMTTYINPLPAQLLSVLRPDSGSPEPQAEPVRSASPKR
ncbi:MAG: hypothetical protein ABSD74_06270 [Rhizomicrobium sp.]|jgi:hypothetical protein